MNFETDPARLLEEAFKKGAVKLPGYFTSALDELPVVSRASMRQDLGPVFARAPLFGELVCGLADVLKTDEYRLTTTTIEPYDPAAPLGFHTDNVAADGLSVLIPLSGPTADFYFADSQPATLEEACHLSYGVGDAIILAQRLALIRDDCTVERSQAHHVGIADEARTLALCDIRQRAINVRLPGVHFAEPVPA